MPEDNVLDAAEHAVEGLEDRGSKYKNLPALLLAGAAFLASLGAFIKSFDHSATEGTYKTTSDLIVKLDERQQKTDQKVEAIRGYLDGLAHAPIMIGPASSAPLPEPAPSGAGAPTASPPVVHSHPIPHPVATTTVQFPDAGAITFAVLPPAQALPAPAAPAPPVRPPAYDMAVKGL